MVFLRPHPLDPAVFKQVVPICLAMNLCPIYYNMCKCPKRVGKGSFIRKTFAKLKQIYSKTKTYVIFFLPL